MRFTDPAAEVTARLAPRRTGDAQRPRVAAAPAQGTIRLRRYRPEIDGLRAIAVVLVILYHGQFRWSGRDPFSGGFIGVDIFLVISGYLIGAILFQEIGEHRFSFAAFYERRARRILPALYVVLLATLPVAWFLMLPTAMTTYGGALASAVLSVSNIFFWYEVSYDASDNLFQPLIHTWSLGVEEQFYLLFPPLLLFLHHHARRWTGQALVAICAGSFLLGIVMTARAPDASFFLLPSRIWEFGIGALLALGERGRDEPTSATRLARHAPIASLVAILACVPFLSVHAYHPGILTLIPVIGTAMVIRYAGREDIAGRCLSSRPMVAVGLISYSLYLWHQPVFAFARLAYPDEADATTKLGWIALAVLLAITTYLLVERTTRNRRIISRQTIWIIALSGAVALAGAGAALFLTKGLPGRFQGPLAAIARADRMEEGDIFQNGMGCLNYVPEKGPCRFIGARKGGYNLLLLGDSHARPLSGALIDSLREAGPLASVTLLNRGGCPPLPGLSRVSGGKPSCPDSYNRRRLRYVQAHPHSVVVLMMRLPALIEQRRFDNRMGGVEQGESPHISLAAGPYERPVDASVIGKSLAGITGDMLRRGTRVVLVYPVPEMGWTIPRKLLARAREGQADAWLAPTDVSVSRAQFHARSKSSYHLLDALGEHPNLARVYPESVLCAGDRCLSHIGTAIFYRDDNHLSRVGAERVVGAIVGTIERRWGPKNY